MQRVLQAQPVRGELEQHIQRASGCATNVHRSRCLPARALATESLPLVQRCGRRAASRRRCCCGAGRSSSWSLAAAAGWWPRDGMERASPAALQTSLFTRLLPKEPLPPARGRAETARARWGGLLPARESLPPAVTTGCAWLVLGPRMSLCAVWWHVCRQEHDDDDSSMLRAKISGDAAYQYQ